MLFRRCLLIYVWLCAVLITLAAQDTLLLHPDTIKMQDLVYQLSEDDLFLQLVGQQGRELAAKEDSLFQARLLTDTTTAFPFHVGVADSVRISNYAKQNYLANPLLLPLYYVERSDSSLFKNSNSIDSLINSDNPAIRQAAIQSKMQFGLRRYVSMTCPALYVGVYDPELVLGIRHEQIEVTPQVIPIRKAWIRDEQEDRLDRIRAEHLRYSHWYKEATTSLQLTQNYVSKNWYAGGNSSFAMLGILQGKIIYRNRKNITWENTAEWRFGFNTVTGDTLRKVNTNEDLFRLYSKFGIKIVDKLNGSMSAEFQTHFFNTWEENTKNIKTGPLTPARLNIALGVDYKPVKRLSIMFAPLTYRFVGVVDTIRVEQTSFSVESGKKILSEFGSSVRVEWRWKPVREFSLETKLYFYTNYKKVEIDLDVTADFIINRFLSARLLLHPRFDNTVILDNDEKAKLQFKELISIGFSHRFR